MSCLGEANEVSCCMSPGDSEAAISGAARSRGCLGQVSGRESATKNRQRDNVLCLSNSRGGGLMDQPTREQKVQGLSHRRKVRVLRTCQQLQVLALIYVTSYGDQINSAGNLFIEAATCFV